MTTKQEVSMLELVFTFGYYFMIGGVLGVLWEDSRISSRRIQKLEMENSDIKGHLADLKEHLEEYDN